MASDQERPVGLTKDVGWQIGVSRTVPIPLEQGWDLVTSPAGRALWLDMTPDLVWEKGARFHGSDGMEGEVRVFKPGSHLRITWHPPGWPRPSTIQVRVLAKGERCVISFHQEHLPDAEARQDRRRHFKAALDGLEGLLAR